MNIFCPSLSAVTILLFALLTIGCSSSNIINYCANSCQVSNTVPAETKPKSNYYPSNLIPVLFVPGLGFGDEPACKDYYEWEELHELFKEHGYKLEIACIPQKGAVENIACALYSEVNRIFPPSENNRFHIIAKSMGGIATRRMLSEHKNEMSDRVLSVTTIATPHKGSEIADLLMSGKQCTVRGKILLTLYKIFKDSDEELIKSGNDLSLAAMESFNQQFKPDPNIPFFSFGYKIDCKDPLCKFRKWVQPFYPGTFVLECWHDEIVSRGGGENDGLVSEKSAQFGTYLGTYEGDHFAETGEPTYFSLMPPLYKGEWIWRDVFEKVIVNLNRQRAVEIGGLPLHTK